MVWIICLFILLFQADEPLALLTAAALHEAGHLLCGFLLSCEAPTVSLGMAGIRLHYFGVSAAWSRIAVSAAGPVVSIILGIIFSDWRMFSLYSVSLGCVNLLPISVLDGGSVMSALCEKFMMPAAAYYFCRAVSIVTIFILLAVNCAVQLKSETNISLAVATVFLAVSVIGREN